MRILGISAFYHDSAAAVVVDGDVVAAAQEERFTRKKHDARFPKHAIAYCLDHCGCSLSDFDAVVFYEKPLIKFERLLETYLSFAPRGFQSFRMAMPVWLREKLFQKHMLTKELRKFAPDFDAEKRLLFCRASPLPRGLGVLSEPLRGSGRADHGRRRRVEHDVAGARPGQVRSRC